ncbi:MAG: chromate transporter [Clostridia bacterium]|nr:chromate transporter [Clostridia bacterium]
MNIFLDLFLTFFKIGAFTFGGGYAMYPIFQRELNEKKKWITEEELIDCYAMGQCTPGVIAVNTASFVGFKTRGVLGAIASTLGMITPSVIIITIIAALIGSFSDNEIVASALSGIRVAVCGMVIVTIWRLIKKNIVDIFSAIIAIATFLVIIILDISTVYAVIASAVVGIIISAIRKKNKKGGENK